MYTTQRSIRTRNLIALGSAQSYMFLDQKAHLSKYSVSENCCMQVVEGQKEKTSVSVIESSLLC